ncbi:hypothetical protein ACVWZX_005338 [Deinococcus sp. UYEF24]
MTQHNDDSRDLLVKLGDTHLTLLSTTRLYF